MSELAYPPQQERRPSPTLTTLHAVARILLEEKDAGGGPVSLAEIARRLPAKRVRHATVRICVDELVLLEMAREDGRGVWWEPAPRHLLKRPRYQFL